MQIVDRRRRGYYTCDHELIKEFGRALGPYGVAVYSVLSSFSNREQECWPSYQTIADLINISRRMAIQQVQKLAKMNLITVEKRKRADGNNETNKVVLLDVTLWRPSAQDALGLVHDLHPADAQDAPEVEPSTKRQINNKLTNTKNKGNGSRKKTWYSDEEASHFGEGLT